MENRRSTPVSEVLTEATPPDIGRELTEGFAGRYIQRKASRLVGVAGFTRADLPDIVQELVLFLLQRLPKFDPKRAHWNAFVVTVIERQIATMIVAQRTIKRMCTRRIGAQAPQLVNDKTDRKHSHPCGDARSLHDAAVSDELPAIELKHDVDIVLARLPRDLRLMCNYLKWDDVGEIARCWHVSRTAIYARLKKLRPTFIRAGVQIPKRISANVRADSSR